jgi:hypothetical protein
MNCIKKLFFSFLLEFETYGKYHQKVEWEKEKKDHKSEQWNKEESYY